MPTEIEAKYRIADLGKIEGKLLEYGAEFLSETMQDDTFFDRPDGSLYREGCGLRLRRIETLRAGSANIPPAELTFKGPVTDDGRAKSRLELQTGLQDPQAICDMLEQLGFAPVATLTKRRRSYFLEGSHVELDEVGKVGCFVEIEAASHDAIEAIRERLGIDSSHLPGSYLGMLMDTPPPTA